MEYMELKDAVSREDLEGQFLERGWTTLAETAAACDLSVNTLLSFLNGERVRPKTVRKIARCLRVSPGTIAQVWTPES